jgi:thioredoxin 1
MVECPEGEFDKYVTDSKGAVVVDFMANWCGPCKLMNPIFKSLAEEYDSVDFVKVDTGTFLFPLVCLFRL